MRARPLAPIPGPRDRAGRLRRPVALSAARSPCLRPACLRSERAGPRAARTQRYCLSPPPMPAPWAGAAADWFCPCGPQGQNPTVPECHQATRADLECHRDRTGLSLECRKAKTNLALRRTRPLSARPACPKVDTEPALGTHDVTGLGLSSGWGGFAGGTRRFPCCRGAGREAVAGGCRRSGWLRRAVGQRAVPGVGAAQAGT
jgi:hypothetical protein